MISFSGFSGRRNRGGMFILGCSFAGIGCSGGWAAGISGTSLLCCGRMGTRIIGFSGRMGFRLAGLAAMTARIRELMARISQLASLFAIIILTISLSPFFHPFPLYFLLLISLNYAHLHATAHFYAMK
jgi:hypothetical protein